MKKAVKKKVLPGQKEAKGAGTVEKKTKAIEKKSPKKEEVKVAPKKAAPSKKKPQDDDDDENMSENDFEMPG